MRVRAYGAALTVLVIVLAGCSGGGSKDSDDVGAELSAEDREAISSVVRGLAPSSNVGIAPEVYEQVSDPGGVLPPGASVRVVDDTFVGTSDRAMVDAVVSVPGSPDAKYWLFLERRNGEWLVYGTMELGQ